MKLYEVAEQIRRVYDMFDSGEIESETLAGTLESIHMDFGDKLEALCQIQREKLSRVDAISCEIDRLQKAQRAEENALERTKQYIMYCLKKAGLEKTTAGIYKVTIRKASIRPVELELDEEEIPAEYKRVTVSVDRKKIAGELTAGTLPEGIAHWGEASEWLSVR